MPMYDFKCTLCDKIYDGLRPVDTELDACPECDGPAIRVWVSKPANVIGDECDIIQENGFKEPRHFRSKSERRRALREVGMEEAVRHVGVPGTDKSPHTTSWDCISQATLDGAREMLERGSIAKSREQVEAELDDAVDAGEVGVSVPVQGGSVNVRIGRIYSGFLDPEVLKR